MEVRIVPSILAADLACLGEEVARAEEGGCDAFHCDIMDWHFAPNLSYGPKVVATMRRLTDLPLDVHLMVDNPLDMIGAFADAGSDYITIHTEALADASTAFEAIRNRGVKPGVTLRPDTPMSAVTGYLASVDIVLVMSVYPGFGGQEFIADSYDRIRIAAEKAAAVNPGLVISVDGGVTFENAPKLVAAGANWLVAGTTVFKNHEAAERVRRLRAAALSAHRE